jgi:phosphoribosylanthranilate isomerase
MKYPENILEVAALLPDYMGFIFWEKSSRYFDAQIPDLLKLLKKLAYLCKSIAIIIDKIIKIIYKQCSYMVKNLQILLKFEEEI